MINEFQIYPSFPGIVLRIKSLSFSRLMPSCYLILVLPNSLLIIVGLTRKYEDLTGLNIAELIRGVNALHTVTVLN